jgi:hypothetical protein
MSSEAAEIYLRQFAEARLRRLAGGTATAADCASRVDAVAAAFQQTDLLDDEVAAVIMEDFGLALATRSPERSTPLHRGQRAPVSTFRSFGGGSGIYGSRVTPPGRGIATAPSVVPAAPVTAAALGRAGTEAEHGEAPGAPVVVPVGEVLRVRADGTGGDADEDIYLLAYVAAPDRAWLTVAARTSENLASRLRGAPGPARGQGSRAARPSTFAGRGMTAADNTGRRYTLGFSGGGGTWYLGRLSLHPAPPPDLEWLDVTCGGRTVRVDLTRQAPEATARITHVAASRAEAYLLQRAEILLSHPGLAAADAAAMACVVPALRAIGALPRTSPVPGQVAALLQRLGAAGEEFAAPGELPERWAGVLAAQEARKAEASSRAPTAGSQGAEPPAKHSIVAAHLAAVLPPVDGVTVTLAGLITRADEGTTVFGAMHPRPDPDIRVGGPSLWLTDDGGWHTVSVRGWSSNGDGFTFQADVVPPLTPAVRDVEFRVTGSGTEIRAPIPLTWWKT